MALRDGVRLAVALLGLAGLTALGIPDGWAQQKQTITYKAPAAISKYTKQHVLDVPDAPGHQIRIYELHRNFKDAPGASAAPVYDGVRAVEEWVHGISDYVNTNGHTWGYSVLAMENGDKILTQWDGTSHTIVGADGSKRSTFVGVARLTGGTGKFSTIRGMQRITVVFNPQTGLNEPQTEGEYWFEGPAAAAATGSTSSGTSGAVAPASAPQPAASPK
jgi:hypothetical protein